MPEMTKFDAGTFCWTDLGTTDATAAKAFYTKLFGWTAVDMPMGDGQSYSMMQKDGKDVCGLYQQQQQGVPAHWLSYVAVDDADASAKKAETLGAKTLMPAFDVMDVGRMAVVQDPTGAAFAIWQAKKERTSLVNEPGSLVWNELMTKDLDRAGSFYCKLFDWTAKTSPGYTEFHAGTKARGGMMQITSEMGPMPSAWGIYFAVADTDATIGKVKELGGRVLMGPKDIPEVGRFAVIQDPQGAVFSVIKMNMK